MAEQDAALRERQPWKAAHGKDFGWLSGVITKHYHGDDSDVKVLIGGIPNERVIGSSDEHGSSIVYHAQPDVFDDGPAKPVRIWSRIGRRPIFAAGNSNGDIPMLEYAAHSSRPSLSMLINHDDNEREIAYSAGAEKSLDAAKQRGWVVVSVKNDWKQVF